uniref:Uncharacterized protein n=1 Tax=Anguilla anguilla TaxID=7936 RepID=A0A0E9QH27_ANGAN
MPVYSFIFEAFYLDTVYRIFAEYSNVTIFLLLWCTMN